MSEIYKEQTVSDYSQPFFKAGNNPYSATAEKASKNLSDMGTKKVDNALNTYSDALKIEQQRGMNDLINTPELMSNPQALDQKINEMNSKMASEIVDENVKINFLVNSELNKQSYINKATANRIKLDDERNRKIQLDSIYASMDTMGVALSNGISGSANADDLLNASIAQQNFLTALEAKNPDGTYILSPEQQISMKDKNSSLQTTYFQDTFDSMPEWQQNDIAKRIEKGDFSLGKVKLKDGNEVDINLENVLDKKDLMSVKAYVKKQIKANRSAKLKEYELEKKESNLIFQQNPTLANFENWKRLHPDASDTAIRNREEIMRSSPNFLAISEDVAEAKQRLLDYADMDFKNQDEEMDYVSQIHADLVKGNSEGVVSVDDLESDLTTLQSLAKDREIKATYKAVRPFYQGFMAGYKKNRSNLHSMGTGLSAIRSFGNWKDNTIIENKVRTIADDYVNQAFYELNNGNIKGFKDKLKEGEKRVIWTVEPELSGKEVGDIITPCGIGYKILGYEKGEAICERLK